MPIVTIRAVGTGAGFVGAALTRYPERQWTSPRLPPGGVTATALPALLAQAEPREARLSDGPLAEVRVALAGVALAVVVNVCGSRNDHRRCHQPSTLTS